MIIMRNLKNENLYEMFLVQNVRECVESGNEWKEVSFWESGRLKIFQVEQGKIYKVEGDSEVRYVKIDGDFVYQAKSPSFLNSRKRKIFLSYKSNF